MRIIKPCLKFASFPYINSTLNNTNSDTKLHKLLSILPTTKFHKVSKNIIQLANFVQQRKKTRKRL